MELSTILGLISAVAVILGVIFALIQLRHYHLARERDSALFLLNSFQTIEVLQGIWTVQGLPNGLAKNEIEAKLGENMRLIYLVMSTWESIGILLFNHEITMDIVKQAYGGPIIFSWQRLNKYVMDVRDDLERDSRFEWFQWLAERMMDQEKVEKTVPAYVAYSDWVEHSGKVG